jgi:hypothetical protein
MSAVSALPPYHGVGGRPDRRFRFGPTAHLRFTPAAVASHTNAACWFTSSASFDNPAVAIGRTFTDAFAGIAPMR